MTAAEVVGEVIWLSVGRCPPAEDAEAGGGDHWFVIGSGGKQGRVMVGRRTRSRGDFASRRRRCACAKLKIHVREHLLDSGQGRATGHNDRIPREKQARGWGREGGLSG